MERYDRSQLGIIEELARFSWSLTSRWLVSSININVARKVKESQSSINVEKDVSLNKGAGSQSLLLLKDKLISSKFTTLFCYDIGDLINWFKPNLSICSLNAIQPSGGTIFSDNDGAARTFVYPLEARDGRSHSFTWYPIWQVTKVHRSALAN